MIGWGTFFIAEASASAALEDTAEADASPLGLILTHI